MGLWESVFWRWSSHSVQPYIKLCTAETRECQGRTPAISVQLGSFVVCLYSLLFHISSGSSSVSKQVFSIFREWQKHQRIQKPDWASHMPERIVSGLWSRELDFRFLNHELITQTWEYFTSDKASQCMCSTSNKTQYIYEHSTAIKREQYIVNVNTWSP